MKKVLFIIIALLGIGSAASAAPFLVEVYQTEPIIFPPELDSTLNVLELSFSLDTACFVQFAAAGTVDYMLGAWLLLDGDSLSPYITSSGQRAPIPLTYTYLVGEGSHTVHLRLRGAQYDYSRIFCMNAYLQALIFLPDEPPAVAEQPDVEPGAQTASVISKGPYVSAPGASELVDASGRVVEAAIVDGKVQISALPPGTYFAKRRRTHGSEDSKSGITQTYP